MIDQNNKKNSAFLQVLFPLFVLIAAIGTGVYFLVFNTATAPITISETADIAAIYLLFLAILPIFITIPLLAFFIFLNIKTTAAVSSASIFITDKTMQANTTTRQIASAAAAPFVEISAWVYVIKQIFSKKQTGSKKE
jgi:hypothetical protein